MKVILRPLPHVWAGVAKYKNCYEDLTPYFIEHGGGKIYTGFTKSAESVKDRKALEKRLNTDLDNDSEFWKTFFIRTRDEDLTLDPTDAGDLLKITFLRNHAFVKTATKQNKAGAKWVLIDEENEAKTENVLLKKKREAYKALDDMSAKDTRDALRLYGVRSDELTEEIAQNQLVKYIEQDPARFISLWVENKARNTYVLIEKGITRGVVRRTNLMYLYGTTDLGKNIEEVCAYLDNPKNQEVKLGIKTAINDKS